MAINKRKILQSAQKHMQKGALDKALKDYMALLKADPKDANVRLKVGDIHLKQGKTDDAVAAYRKVAEQFMTDGFDAKAVAIFKQVTKIDAKRFDIFLPLSELYQRMGLTSEAMRALQTAADGAYREGDKDQALDLLRKMAALDPANTTNRLKVAELLKQEGRDSEAVAEFQEVVAELERQGDDEERVRVIERLVEVGASDRDTMIGLGRSCLEAGRFDLAIRQGQTLIDADASDADGYEILGAGYDGAQQIEERTAIYTKLAEIYRERGDDDLARDVIQRFGGDTVFGAEASDEPVFGSEGDVPIEDSPELSDPGYASADGLAIGEPISDLADEPDSEDAGEASDSDDDSSASGLSPLPTTESSDAAPVDPAAGEGDPEQLLAEASVYLRYGKRERALESLRAVLASHPDHRGALEKLAEALDDDGEELEAVKAQLAGLGGASAPAAEEEPPALEADADDDEFDIEFEDDEEDVVLDEGASPEAPIDAAADAADDVEIDLDAGADEVLFEGDSDSVTIQDDGASALEPDSDDSDVDFDLSVEEETDAAPIESEDAELDFEFDDPTDGDDSGAVALDAESAPSAGAAEQDASDEIAFDIDEDAVGEDSLSAGSDVDPVQTQADADAADPDDEFVIDLDAEGTSEAESEPESEEPEPEETGDLKFAFETDDDDVADEAEDEPPALDAPELDLDLEAEGEDGLDGAMDEPLEDEEDDDATESGVPRSASLTTPAQVVEELEEADFYFEQGMYTEAREIYERIVAGAPNHPQAQLRLGEIDAAEGHAPGQTSQGTDDAVAAGSMDMPELDETPDLGEDLGTDEVPDLDGPEIDETPEIDVSSDVDVPDFDDEPVPEEDTSPTDGAVAAAAAIEDPVLGPDADALEASDEDEAAREPIRPTDVEADITAPEMDSESLEDDAANADEGTDEASEDAEETVDEDDASAEETVDEDDASADEAVDEDEASEDEVADDEGAAEPLAAAAEDDDAVEDQEDDDAFDLAAELSDAFDDATSGPAASASTEEEGFEQVFAAFKQGVQNELEETDHEAHYDLGIAYKEMGLLEDAIGEFQAALSDERQISCLHMMALCSLDLGRTADAVANLEQALSVAGVPDDQSIGVRFDLGRAYAKQGDVERARAAFEAVRELDADFCDVGQHLSELESAPSGEEEDASGEGEAFESFDDLIASTEDTEEPVAAAPEYESFDDLMGDDDEAEEAPEPEPEPEVPEPAAAVEEPAAGGDEEPPKKKGGRRKKKTSFV